MLAAHLRTLRRAPSRAHQHQRLTSACPPARAYAPVAAALLQRRPEIVALPHGAQDAVQLGKLGPEVDVRLDVRFLVAFGTNAAVGIAWA